MVYGDHGRKIMAPMTSANHFAMFPFKEFYSKLLHFRVLCRTGVTLLAGYGYFAYTNGLSGLAFTPYVSVHHAISHKFAHDMEHIRYPIEHHDDKKH